MSTDSHDQSPPSQPAPLPPPQERPWSDYWLALKMLSPIDALKRMPSKPCARDSQLAGIAGGAGIGIVRLAATRRLNSACGWAVTSWAVISGAAYIRCRQARAEQQRLIGLSIDKYMTQRGFRRSSVGLQAPDDVVLEEQAKFTLEPGQVSLPMQKGDKTTPTDHDFPDDERVV